MAVWRRLSFWTRYFAAMAGCLIVLAFASYIGANLRQHALRPPNLHVRMGDMHLVGFTAYPAMYSSPKRCTSGAPRCARPQRSPVYAIWLVDRKRISGDPKQAFSQILAIPLSVTQLIESLSR